MQIKTILLTGANGEIGRGLITHLSDLADVRIIALDLHAIEEPLRSRCYRTATGDILDAGLLESLSAAYDFDSIYHLAALLSTKSERQPTLAHRVNVDGTLNLLEMAMGQSRLQGREIKFLYPSSIAVYGLPSLEIKAAAGAVPEDSHLKPRTMYGINKLYCEELGRYYSSYYRQLDAQPPKGRVDFRGLRFPGLISAATVPTGGTSDFAPEILHHAAQKEPYACFVREDTRIPFMAMPDAIKALLELEAAPRENLTRQVYNIGAFNPSAGEVVSIVHAAFPAVETSFSPDLRRQSIVDSWPQDVDDRAARSDWGWKASYDLNRAFSEYLIPGVVRRYRQPRAS
ncbi:MAG: NAD-dependent epimerase/dehydratase family protein [Acidobacteria bacterium]|nr:NAD-dependent epimerase/dehydratase family protein [Acidobacteriota bacterium]MCG3192739.1 putative epimerase/dehydratase [Thermoanaerobaculia bacterium]MCK6682290.1 NAD-dependent epimerase/dehydratase family protein [Thermoanaerobaculia bacterium]